MILFGKDVPQRSDLTGLFVGKRALGAARAYTRPALVVAQSGNRLTVRFSMKNCGRAGIDGSVLADVAEWDETASWLERDVAYVCDVLEEAEAVMRASKSSQEVHAEALRAAQRRANEIFDTLTETEEAEASS